MDDTQESDDKPVYKPTQSSSRSRRSDVWEFMTKQEPNSPVIVCNLCGMYLTASSKGGTSNMRYHLINRHPDKYQRRKKLPSRSLPAKAIQSKSEDECMEKGEEKGGDTSKNPGPIIADSASASASTSSNSSSASPSTMSVLAVKAKPNSNDSSVHHHGQPPPKRKLKALKADPSPPLRDQSVHAMIFKMLVKDLLPLSIVEGDGFRELIDGLHKGFAFPTKITLEDHLRNNLKEGRVKLGARLAEERQKIGLTCDLWTDNSSRNYITLTAHVIREWCHESWILGTIMVNASTTDEEVSLQIRALCLECGVNVASVVGVVYGMECNQPVADAMERLGVLKSICAYLSWECRPCAGALLGISIQNALTIQPVSDLILAAEHLLTYLTTHSELYEKLSAALQERNHTSTLTLCDTSSRWQMVCDMLSQLAELQEPIADVLEDNQGIDLTEEQWKLLQELIKLLQIVRAAVAVMSDVKNKSVSCWLPVIQGVMQKIDVCIATDGISDDGLIFLTTLKSELQVRCELSEIRPSSLIMLASAVDPRFHHLRFLSEEDRVPVIDELKHQVSEQYGEAKDSSAGAQEESALFTLFGEDEFNQKGSKPEDEVELFCLERPVSRETDPLSWWHLNEDRFPQLARFAKAVLCVPAAATSMSMTDEVKANMENRKRLESPEIVDAQLFLHKNQELFL